VNQGLYKSGVSMSVQMRRLETISRNIANIGTVGYKRGSTAVTEFRVPGRFGETRGLKSRSVVDFSQGELQRTGRPLDLALYGEGFFALEGPEGELYTRNGALHVTAEGELVTEDGYPIAWDVRGERVDPTGFPVEIDAEGNIRQGSAEIGRLRIVNFDDPSVLRRGGPGLWQAPPRIEEAAHTAVVHQGALEGSNATAIHEMVEMIETQRAFESSARLMSSIEQSYRRLTRPF